MTRLCVADVSGTSVPDCVNMINDELYDKEGVYPDAIISVQYEPIDPPIAVSGGGQATVSLTVFFLKDP